MFGTNEDKYFTGVVASLFTMSALFAILKVSEIVTWSWWFVLAPILFLPALLVAIFCLCALFMLLYVFISVSIEALKMTFSKKENSKPTEWDDPV